MQIRLTALLLILLACAAVFSAPVDLCVTYECEGCVSVRVVKVDSTVKEPQWKLKDSIECECGFWLEPSFEIPDLPGRAIQGSGGACMLIGGKKSMMEMPPVPKMILREGDTIYPAYYVKKEEISAKYRHNIDLLWKAHFTCSNDHSRDTTLVYKMDATLIGECSKIKENK